MIPLLSFLGLFLIPQSASAALQASGIGDTVVHIVSTTDLHGYLLEQKATSGLPIGGVDTMTAYFDLARKADPETVFLDSGDLFQGTIISNHSLGSTVVRWMNFSGYTASVIGNHDFDFGPGDGHSVVVKPGEDPLGALKAREAEAHFSFLSANICSVDEDPEQCKDSAHFLPASFTRPYLIKEVHGVQLGVIGLTTPETPETTMPSNVSRLRFIPMKDALERFVLCRSVKRTHSRSDKRAHHPGAIEEILV